MSQTDNEERVKACYSTWGSTYYDEYYGDKAPYPPVHRDLIKRLLIEAKVSNVLDAGCGPASFLRDMTDTGIALYGFDLTPEMVAEGHRVIQEQGIPADHIWEGSVLSPNSFHIPNGIGPQSFDAAICIGVLPHIPEQADVQVIANLHGAVKKDGLVIIEARNQLFALFTQNRYSYRFIIDELIQPKVLKQRAGERAAQLATTLEDFQQHFRMDLPPVRKGKADEPGYDEVLSRTHNPLILKEQFASAGFGGVRVLFYHFHCLPPVIGSLMPRFFREQSLAMENPDDWRGYFMASAFLLVGRRA